MTRLVNSLVAATMLIAAGPAFAGTPWQVVIQVSEAQLIRPAARAEIPWELEAVVLRAMSADPTRRYPSASALGDDVQRFRVGGRLAAARRAHCAVRNRRVPPWRSRLPG